MPVGLSMVDNAWTSEPDPSDARGRRSRRHRKSLDALPGPIEAIDRGTSLHQKTCEALRNAIIVGRLNPGQRVVETTLSNTLGVSRTPVREAIRSLCHDVRVQVGPVFNLARAISLTARSCKLCSALGRGRVGIDLAEESAEAARGSSEPRSSPPEGGSGRTARGVAILVPSFRHSPFVR